MKKPYYLRYKRIKEETIELIREMIKSGYFKLDYENQKERLIELNKRLSEIYYLREPRLIFNDDLADILGPSYNEPTNKIHLVNGSIISYLHEFKHSIQAQRKEIQNERVARGWSLSLFYQASPKNFMKQTKQGKILFV